MDRFQHKYRIPSTRLQQWDYRWAGAYFITVCTQNRKHYFGEIIDGTMHLSHVGVIADILWYEIPHHAQYVELGAFVVMPNHIHGILIKTQNDLDDDNVENRNNGDINGDINGDDNGDINVETGHALSLPPPPTSDQTIGQQRFQNIGKNSISSIVGSYKSAVTKHARRLGFDFHWQTRFYDHIIRDERAFQTISDYIIHNPARWQEDKFFKPE
jgi:REP element-mobilizing transposase RayT